MEIIEVFRHTTAGPLGKQPSGKVGQLVSVQCVIDGRRTTVPADEWKHLVRRPDVTVTLSAQENEWPE